MTTVWKHLLVLCLLVPTLAAEESSFRFRELKVTTSPSVPSELVLTSGSTVVDYDLWPTGPDVLILLHDASGNHVAAWHLGETGTTLILDLPSGFDAHSIAVHPAEHRFFVGGKSGQQSNILVVENLNGKWAARKIYQSAKPIRRLLVAPRPYEVSWDEAIKQHVVKYRLFFAERESNGSYSTRSITEDGKREYQVIGPESSYVKMQGPDEEQPKPNFFATALPEAFHPGGHILIWQDGKGCFQQLGYQRDNWDKPSPIAGNPCGGSLTVTPNGTALLHWKHGEQGVSVLSDHSHAQEVQAREFTFITTPSSTPDGKGIVGLIERGDAQVLVYSPINLPLADVVNAWMFMENSEDQQKLTKSAGLFRSTRDEQLYQLYDTEQYYCGGYDSATPTRPYFVTTDIFWELVGAAYEGTFIVQERQQAMPAFWDFVAAARQQLQKSAPNSTWTKAFDAAAQSRDGVKAASAEARQIARADGSRTSPVFGAAFNFTELKPRGHYAATPAMAAYFKAVHYLTSLAAAKGVDELNILPAEVKQKAVQWIAAYRPFIAPSRAPLAWNSGPFSAPEYARHSLAKEQLFPLSWGFDNEVLLSTVYHGDWPVAEQITGANGQRLLPTGLDLAAALGSGYAESLLKVDLAEYSTLGPALKSLRQRAPKNAQQTNLYDAWINALAIEWSDDKNFPSVTDDSLWKAKQLQTGLASWATLRHATVLVNERTVAECGEGGFESVVLRPPRGYVEPDPTTFRAIASLLDDMKTAIAALPNLKGDLPNEDWDAAKALPLRNGIIRRLQQSAEKARLFASIAEKELRNEELSDKEYEEILHVGARAEHDLLIYKSLADKDLALSTPDPMMKIADVAGGGATPYLEAAVGRPLEWDQAVPFFGRREIVKGSVYSYYEFSSPTPMTDLEWAGKHVSDTEKLENWKPGKDVPGKVDQQKRPAWLDGFISKESLSCPAKAPF